MLVFVAFVSIGLPDAIFGVAWPSISAEFSQPNAAVGWLNIPGSLAYMVSSASVGTAIGRLGIARMLPISTAIVGAGLTLYACVPSFWIIIPAVMLLAFGSGAIDAALNTFAAEELPTRYMSWLHAFYGLGALIGPFIMAGVFGLGQSWRVGYAVIAFMLIALSIVFVLTRRAWQTHADIRAAAGDEPPSSLPMAAVLRMPRVWGSLALIFATATSESVASLWIASSLIERFGWTEAQAGIGAGMYWVGMTGGRIVIPIIWSTTSSIKVMRVASTLVLIAALMMVPSHTTLFVCGVALIGLANAPLFPAAMSITPQRFGRDVAAHAIGFQVSTSTVAFAAMPLIAGAVADRWGMDAVPWIIVVASIAMISLQVLLRRGDTPPA